MRFKTREVLVGNVGIGGKNPIRIQSMTTSDTNDIPATVDQIMRLSDEGCEIARVTVQGKKEAASCEHIKNTLLQKGYDIPLVADIHFYPPAAILAADFVEKIRINPGNFGKFEKVEETLLPLLEKCKKLKRAIRIGVNHGSLSERITSQYGNTPKGMVVSALEFTDICRKNDYHDLVISMKASNTKVMIEAYRQLVSEMEQRSWDYPLHLGVTEAGSSSDGRIKSAVGIGSLLLEGIGDTIRISLTEDPWHEIDSCKRLIDFASKNVFVKKDLKMEPRSVNFLHPNGSVIVCSDKQIANGDAIFTNGKIISEQNEYDVLKITNQTQSECEELIKQNPKVIFLSPQKSRLDYARNFFSWIDGKNIPVILNFSYDCSEEDLIIRASAELGSLLCDSLGDGICLQGPYNPEFLCNLSFKILQATRKRMSETEFISCPSCGRTLFDIQTTLDRIKKKVPNIPGLKVAVMGCIVNGPGEMADADFGYVGSGPGKVDLFVGQTCVEKNIDESIADEKLVKLIEEKWL